MIAVLAFALLIAAEPMFGVESEPRKPPEAVAEKLTALLDGNALKVTDAQRETVMTFWLRKRLPASGTAEQVRNGLTTREVPEGTFVGVVEFSKRFTDYRKQEISAGTYTLRLAFQPDIGDHKETAPHTEFLLLVPVGDDGNPEALDGKTLLKLSGKATGGDHPGVLLLVPVPGKPGAAKVVPRGSGLQVLTLARELDIDGEISTLGLGVTVHGVSKSR